MAWRTVPALVAGGLATLAGALVVWGRGARRGGSAVPAPGGRGGRRVPGPVAALRCLVEVFERPLASFQLTQAKLADMALVRTARLSVQPVTAEEWKEVCRMGGLTADKLPGG